MSDLENQCEGYSRVASPGDGLDYIYSDILLAATENARDDLSAVGSTTYYYLANLL